MKSKMRENIRTLILLMITTIFLSSCNQTKNDKKGKSIENKQTKNIVSKTVSLSVEPNVFKLSELPETVEVTMTNNTNDTITTGLHYQIEHYKNNEWIEVSPDQFFQDLGYRLTPSDFHTFDKRLLTEQIDYNVGKFRIVKYYLKFDYQKTKTDFKVYAEFNIEK